MLIMFSCDLIKFPCNQCDHIANRRDSLRAHVRTKHKLIRYTCERCQFKFTEQKDLKRHVEAQHEGVIYQCEYCDHKAKQKRHLRNHINIRHKGVNYPCDQCNFKTKWKTNLREHINTKHKGIAYTCDECDYKTIWRNSLQIHKNSKHEGVTSPCDQCDYIAIRRSYLLKHIKIKHLKSTVNIEILPAQEQEIKTKKLAFDDEGQDDFISEEEEDERIENSKHLYCDNNQTVKRERKGVLKLFLCPISSCTFSHKEDNLNLELDHLKERHPHVDNQMSFMVLQ